jgi:hypothetical protein
MFGGSVGTDKASHLCVVLRESANNNPQTILITFYSVTDYAVYFLKLIMDKYEMKNCKFVVCLFTCSLLMTLFQKLRLVLNEWMPREQ